MRTATILSLVAGAIALTFTAAVPRANALTTTAPAIIDTAAPNNGQVEKVRYVCRRYRVRRYGRWHWRTRCYWRPDRYYHRPYRSYRSYRYHRPYRSYRRYY
jgi:hypothetical protein